MKITDIISEDKLPEGLAAKAFSKVFGKAIGGAADLVGKGNTGRAVDALAAKIARGEQVAIADAEKLVGKDAAKKTLAAAEKEAEASARVAKMHADLAGIGEMAGAVKKWSGIAISAGLNGAYYWMMYEPLRDYLNNINVAEGMLKDGKVTPEDFDAYRKREMSGLIGKWTALWATGKLAKLPFGVVSRIFQGFSKTPNVMSKAISGLGTAGQVYFMNKVNSPENAKAIAEFMAGPIMTPIFGGVGTKAEDVIRSFIPGAHEIPSAEPTDPEQQGNDKPAGDAQDADKPADDSASPAGDKPQATPKDKWVYYAPGLVQDPVTKEIDYK